MKGEKIIEVVECNIIQVPGEDDWLKIRNDFLVSKRTSSNEVPNSKLKTKYLFSEHTPLYGLQYTWEWINIPYWVAMHFKTHHIGIHQITSSQRNDIQKEYNRKNAPQDSPVNHRCIANPVAIMSLARKRLCLTASNETRIATEIFLEKLELHDPELAKLCVRPCVYRNGICPEIFSNCKFNQSKRFESELEEYKYIIAML